MPGSHRSIMIGLNCGMPSPIAWPKVALGVDWFVAIDDETARTAMRDLTGADVITGETGAASLAGLRALLADTAAAAQLPEMSNKTALVIATEGPTDPGAYERIVGTTHI